MNILVTGANGQLGNEIRFLASTTKNKFNYYFTDVAELDISDSAALNKFSKENKIDIIINCAAYTNVDKAEDNEAISDLINNIATANLAALSKRIDAVLIHVSTDYVFNGSKNTPYTETDSTNALGIYGKTKLAGEKSIKESGCKYLIFRTSWLYSEYGNNFVKTMLRLTTEKDSLKVVFDQVGTPTYAGDLADMILYIIEKNIYINFNGIYHFSNEGVCSWYDFAKEIADVAGNSCDIQPCHSNEFPSKVKRPSFSVMDKSKLKSDFKYTVPYWKDSLKKCITKLQTQ